MSKKITRRIKRRHIKSRRRRTYKAGMLRNASKGLASGVASGVLSVAKTKAQDELLRKNNRISNVFNENPSNAKLKKFNVINPINNENNKENYWKGNVFEPKMPI